MAQKPRKGMHLENIKAELRKKYGPITLLAKSWGLNPNAIIDTLRRPNASKRVEGLIAAALQMRVQDIWPERWDENGVPLPRSSRPKPIRPAPANSSQNREAA